MRRRFVYAVLCSIGLHGLIVLALLLLARPAHVPLHGGRLAAGELSVSMAAASEVSPRVSTAPRQRVDQSPPLDAGRDEADSPFFLDPGFGSPYDLPALYSIFGSKVDLDWYTAEALDVRAEPMHDILLPPLMGELAGPGRMILEVFIDEFGLTERVDILSAGPSSDYDEMARAVFAAARWSPAIKDGRFVRSRKLIEICLGDCSTQAAGADGHTEKGIPAP